LAVRRGRQEAHGDGPRDWMRAEAANPEAEAAAARSRDEIKRLDAEG